MREHTRPQRPLTGIKNVSEWHSARQPDPGDHYSRTIPLSCLPASLLAELAPWPPFGIYRSWSFVLVKRIINTYNGFLRALSRLYAAIFPRHPSGPSSLRELFFTGSISLCLPSALHAALPKYSYELCLLISIPRARAFYGALRYGYFNRQLLAKYVRHRIRCEKRLYAGK